MKKIKRFEKKKSKIDLKLRKLYSIRFIERNKIKAKDVAFSDAERTGQFYLGDDSITIFDFANFVKNKNPKKWIEWNGRLYLLTDLLNKRLDLYPEGMSEDLLKN